MAITKRGGEKTVLVRSSTVVKQDPGESVGALRKQAPLAPDPRLFSRNTVTRKIELAFMRRVSRALASANLEQSTATLLKAHGHPMFRVLAAEAERQAGGPLTSFGKFPDLKNVATGRLGPRNPARTTEDLDAWAS